MKTHPIILSSKSEIRATLLRNAGVDFVQWNSAYEEKNNLAQNEECCTKPELIAISLAENKAILASQKFENYYSIGCDQILYLNNKVLHKVTSRKAAFDRLRALSGKSHHLKTAVCLALNGSILWSHIENAKLTMHSLRDNEIQNYLDKYLDSVYASVGVYKLESCALNFFKEINGDYFSMLGLPLVPLLNQLRFLGA